MKRKFRVGDVVVCSYTQGLFGELGIIESTPLGRRYVFVDFGGGAIRWIPTNRLEVIDHIDDDKPSLFLDEINKAKPELQQAIADIYDKSNREMAERMGVGFLGQLDPTVTEHQIRGTKRVLRLECCNTLAKVICKSCGHVIWQLDLTTIE
jgi:hypothetical protein